VIYLDTSALLKLVRSEPETDALGVFINAHTDTRWFASEIAHTELVRTVRRINHDEQGAVVDDGRLRAELAQVASLCDGLDLVPLSSRLLSDAAAIEQPFLRTLDAIHVSTAAGFRASVSAFVTYDKRLATAAEEAGLPVASPG
jgi:uncharacterized protein